MFSEAIEKLKEGKVVEIRPRGNSMTPKIKSGQLVTLSPVDADSLKKGDAVIVKVGRNIYVHLIKALEKNRVLIGNNHGKINGWTMKSNVYGIVTKVEN